jgi:hypothetical protein
MISIFSIVEEFAFHPSIIDRFRRQILHRYPPDAARTD